MKRFLTIFLVSIICISAAFAGIPAFILADGDIDDVKLYEPGGIHVSGESYIKESGSILKADSPQHFTSPYGDIILEGNSLLVVSGFDYSNPSLYLVYGQVTVLPASGIGRSIAIYTPTTRTRIKEAGEYVFRSTDDEECVYNFSSDSITAFDSVNGKEYGIGPMEKLDFFEYASARVTSDEFYRNSTSRIMPEIVDTAEPAAIEMPAEPMEEPAGSSAIEESPAEPEEAPLMPQPGAAPETPEMISPILSQPYEVIRETRIPEKPEIIAPILQIITPIPEAPELFHIIRIVPDKREKAAVPAPVTVIRSESKPSEPDSPSIIMMDRTYYPDRPIMENSRVYVPSMPLISYEKTPSVPKAPLIEAVSELQAPEITISASVSYLDDEAAEASPEEAAEDIQERAIEEEYSVEPAADNEIEQIASEDTIRETAAAEEDKKEEAKPLIAGAAPEKKAEFDISLSARGYSDSAESTISTAIIPSFKYGGFSLSLSIDPVRLLSYQGNADAFDWIGYSLSPIEDIRYRSFNEKTEVFLSRRRNLEGDTLSLYSGVSHSWDKAVRQLAFNAEAELGLFSARIYSDNLDFTPGSRTNTGISASVSFGKEYPASLSIEAITSLDARSIADSRYYPGISLYLPFFFKGFDNAGFRASFATLIKQAQSGNPFTENGFMTALSIPMNFSGFSLSAGLAFSHGSNLHYMALSSSASSASDTLTFFLDGGYASKAFSLDGELWMDLDPSQMKLTGDSFARLEAKLSIYSYNIGLGVKALKPFDFAGYLTGNAEAYASIGYDNGSVASSLSVMYGSNGFAFALSGTASLLGTKANAGTERKGGSFPFSFDLMTSFRHTVGEDGVFRIIPSLSIGKDDYLLALRVPLAIKGNGNRIELQSENGNKWWLFGTDRTGIGKVFGAIASASSLIDSISIGSENSVGYFKAERGYIKDGTVFSSFGRSEALSARAGFNFRNLSFSLYVSDLESPSIGEFRLGFYPVDLDGMSLSISIPSYFAIIDHRNLRMSYYPEFRFDVPMFSGRFKAALFAIGEISSSFDDGNPTDTKVIFDFSAMRFHDYMIGASMDFSFSPVAFSLEGGLRNGAISPDMFSAFEAIRYDFASSSVLAENAIFAKAKLDLAFSAFRLGLSYSANDIMSLAKNPTVNDDLLAFSIDADITRSTYLSLSLRRKGLVSAIKDGVSFIDFMNSQNTIFSAGLEIDYGKAVIAIDYSTAVNTVAGDYANIPVKASGNNTSAVTLSLRFCF